MKNIKVLIFNSILKVEKIDTGDLYVQFIFVPKILIKLPTKTKYPRNIVNNIHLHMDGLYM